MRVRILSTILASLTLVGCTAATPSSSWTDGKKSPGPTPTPTAAITAAPTPSPTPAPPADVELKVMDFNIEYGGQQIDFARIVEAVKLADPDVVAIEEAEGHTQELADKAGYPYANVRNQVISKYPIIDPPGADGHYVYIEVAQGAFVALSNVHLPSDPYGPYLVRDGGSAEDVIKLEQETRMPAIQERLDVLPALVAAGIPTFLTGDFNAPSHLDWTDATVGKLPQIRYPLAWPVSSAIEAAGFTDSYRALHPDPVADPGLTWWADRPIVDDYPDHKDPQDRIDIIYSAGAAHATDIKIIGEKDGPQVDLSVDPWGTDHRSVMGTFTVSPGVAAPYIAVDQRLVTTGDPVTVRFHGPADRASFSAAAGTAAITDVVHPITGIDGTWDLPTSAIPPGDYRIELMAGGSVLSTIPLSIAAVGARPALTIDGATVKSGDPITVTWRDAPGSRWDWIGVYKQGGDPLVDSYLFYVYTDQGVQGSAAIDEKGFAGDLAWPLPAGEYDAIYLLDDGYQALARASFTVTP